MNRKTWLEEFKVSGWFDRILLTFPYLLGGAAFLMFFMEWLKTGPV